MVALAPARPRPRRHARGAGTGGRAPRAGVARCGRGRGRGAALRRRGADGRRAPHAPRLVSGEGRTPPPSLCQQWECTVGTWVGATVEEGGGVEGRAPPRRVAHSPRPPPLSGALRLAAAGRRGGGRGGGRGGRRIRRWARAGGGAGRPGRVGRPRGRRRGGGGWRVARSARDARGRGKGGGARVGAALSGALRGRGRCTCAEPHVGDPAGSPHAPRAVAVSLYKCVAARRVRSLLLHHTAPPQCGAATVVWCTAHCATAAPHADSASARALLVREKDTCNDNEQEERE
jgi:hypothetical protein